MGDSRMSDYCAGNVRNGNVNVIREEVADRNHMTQPSFGVGNSVASLILSGSKRKNFDPSLTGRNKCSPNSVRRSITKILATSTAGREYAAGKESALASD